MYQLISYSRRFVAHEFDETATRISQLARDKNTCSYSLGILVGLGSRVGGERELSDLVLDSSGL
jgi:hypothetical protein